MLRRKFTIFYVINMGLVPPDPPPLVTDIAPLTRPCSYVSAEAFGRIWREEKLL